MSFKISTVIPIYNTEEYLKETIESVLHQSIGFFNIQIILVNNGTEDNAEVICLDYQKRYPDNIIYIKLDGNNGPCAARNAGMRVAEGRYINFLDSDDKWEKDAYEKAYDFFEEHYGEIDIVACRIRYFEAIDKWHGLDYKFDDGNQIVDVKEKYDYVQLSICSTLIKRQALQDVIHDERVRHAEDAKFVTEIILKKLKYGLMRDAVFYYRQRNSGNSTLQNVVRSSNWYVETMDYVYRFLMDESVRLQKEVIDYIQFLVMYELQWRITKAFPVEFTDAEKKNYTCRIEKLLHDIDDEMIFRQKSLWIEYMLYCYELKHGDKANIAELMSRKGYYSKCIYVDRIWYKDGRIQITGFLRIYKGNEIGNIYIDTIDEIPKQVETEKIDDKRQVYVFAEQITEGKAFKVDMPFEDEMKIVFWAEINGYLVKQKVYIFSSAKINVATKRTDEDEMLVIGGGLR